MQAENANNSRRLVFREEIRNTIRDAIFSGQLKPGDRIIETYWAKEMGVSQGPVREAIRDLEAMGLVETVPFKGSRVRNLTKKYIRDNYNVRMCLEAKSIHDAINLSDGEFKKMCKALDSALKSMRKYAEQANLQAFTECDAVFHRAIFNAVDNEALLKTWEQCNIRNWFMLSMLTDSASLLQLYQSHEAIYQAIAEREVEKAEDLLENQLISMMNGFIDELGE